MGYGGLAPARRARAHRRASGRSATTACRATGRSSTAARSRGRQRLRDGDVVRVGRTTIAYRRPDAEDSRPTQIAGEPVALGDLPPIQRQVLIALARPYKHDEFAMPATNQDIADELHLSVDAVKCAPALAVRSASASSTCRRTRSARGWWPRRCRPACCPPATSSPSQQPLGPPAGRPPPTVHRPWIRNVPRRRSRRREQLGVQGHQPDRQRARAWWPCTRPTRPRSGAGRGSSTGWRPCRDLAELKASHPMMDAVIDEIDGRMIRVGDQLARRLRLLQLPRLRPRPRDHRGGPRVPRRLGHASELVAPARQPGALRGDRGAPDRAARLRGLARPADDHPHPHVGDPAARRVGHDLPRRARAQDDLRRLPGRPRPRRRGQALPLRGPRPPRRAAARRARSDAPRLHGRRQQHDRQRARTCRAFAARRARATARCSTSTTPTASA